MAKKTQPAKPTIKPVKTETPAKKKAATKKPVKKKQANKVPPVPIKAKKITKESTGEVNKGGAPEIWSQELADKVCEAIATSQKSLRTICQEDGMPSVATVLKWLREDKEGFTTQYARAKEEQADLMAEDMLDISDHTDEDHTPFTGGNVVQRDRLRIETRKWLASKLKPKKYGDKLDVTTHNKTIIVEHPDENEE